MATSWARYRTLTEAETAQIEQTLRMLEVGDPERPLFLPREPRIREQVGLLKREWRDEFRPRIDKMLGTLDDGERRHLADLFFVIATQNPVEFRGTYPLPEAQMDRFAMQFTLGYVQPAEEVAVLTAQANNHPLDDLKPCASFAEVTEAKRAAQSIRISEELKRYVVDLTSATRSGNGVQLGASPRASLALMKAAQALALYDGLEFVTPEQIQELAVPVIAHRLVMQPQARFSGLTARGVVEEVVKQIKVPA